MVHIFQPANKALHYHQLIWCVFEEAICEARALIVRGFNKNALDKAWIKYAYTRAKDYVLRTSLTNRFKPWVGDQDFSAAAESDPEKKHALCIIAIKN